MPEKIVAKYTSKSDEHYMGVPARDLTEDEFNALSDEQKAMLAESSFYTLRHDAPAEAEKATKRVAKAEDAPTVLEAQAMADMPEPPKDGGKK